MAERSLRIQTVPAPENYGSAGQAHGLSELDEFDAELETANIE